MQFKKLTLLAIAALCGLASRAPVAHAVVLRNGNGNIDVASLAAALGPANPALPGWVSVGKSSTGQASVTYLGNGWVITAAHVTIDNNIGGNPSPITFGPNPFFADMSTIHVLTNPDNSISDLKVFRLTSDPGLPSAIPALLNNSPPTGRAIMIGNGLSTSGDHFWNVNTSNPNNWVWTTQAQPASPGLNDYGGLDINSQASHVIRWGENNVFTTGESITVGTDPNTHGPIKVFGFTTAFDDQQYTGAPALPSEGQASQGDSGGPVFTLVGGQWELSGVMNTVLEFNNQPDSTAVFGDLTLISDLSVYRDQILALVPEPSSGVLAALSAVAAVGLVRRHRR